MVGTFGNRTLGCFLFLVGTRIRKDPVFLVESDSGELSIQYPLKRDSCRWGGERSLPRKQLVNAGLLGLGRYSTLEVGELDFVEVG